MKSILVLFMVVSLAGCGLELVTSTAIQGELQAEQLKAIKNQVGQAADSTAKVNIQRAIDTHYAETGQYPAQLEDLVPNYLPSLPMGPDGAPYAYDPVHGKLLDAVAPTVAGPTITGIDSATQQHNQQQEEALKELGM